MTQKSSVDALRAIGFGFEVARVNRMHETMTEIFGEIEGEQLFAHAVEVMDIIGQIANGDAMITAMRTVLMRNVESYLAEGEIPNLSRWGIIESYLDWAEGETRSMQSRFRPSGPSHLTP